MKIDAELFDLCKEFIKENKITEDYEELGGLDWPEVHEFITNICGLVGYYDNEEEDLDFDEE